MSTGKFVLIADVGGTNARFALCAVQTSTAPSVPPQSIAEQSLLCDQFDSLGSAAKHYLQLPATQVALAGTHPEAGAIAVACPIVGDEVRMTNRDWSFSQHNLANDLKLHRLVAINDFAAMAWGITALQAQDVSVIYDADRQGLHLNQGPITVFGPGTGLGVALLVGEAHAGSSRWQAVATEGGHVSFAPLTSIEQRLQAVISRHFERCSTERLLCGTGLSHIEKVMRDLSLSVDAIDLNLDLINPGDIVQAALQGDGHLRAVLNQFCAMLGSAAGDAVLMHGAKALVLAGGILPRFVDFLTHSAFLERYFAKARFRDYLRRVPIYLATHHNPGLLGAAVFAGQELKPPVSIY